MSRTTQLFPDPASSNANIRRLDRDWVCNDFRDDGTQTFNSQSMFTYSPGRIDQNSGYLDLTKNWSQRRKFTDKWVGIRLIGSYSQNKLVNLYSVDTSKRKAYR